MANVELMDFQGLAKNLSKHPLVQYLEQFIKRNNLLGLALTQIWLHLANVFYKSCCYQ